AVQNPSYGTAVNEAMSSYSSINTTLVLEALEPYDVSGISHLCDVGGGHGYTLCSLLVTYPHLKGTVLELPSVIAKHELLWADKMGVGDRCTYVPGDMFQAVPPADAYMVKRVLHDWSDAECRQILSTMHRAAPPHGRVLIMEQVVPDPDTPHFSKLFDIPTVSPLLTPITACKILLLQSLPNSTLYQQTNVRRRKDAHRVGPAARRSLERLSRLPRRLPSDGGSSSRVRRALSTRAGNRGWPTQRAPLPPGTAVQSAREECRGHRDVRRCRAPDHPRLHRHGALGSSALGDRVSRTSGCSVGRTRWHHRVRSQQFPQTWDALGGRQTAVVWPPGQG